MADIIEAELATRDMQLKLIGAFAFLALLLAAIGIALGIVARSALRECSKRYCSRSPSDPATLLGVAALVVIVTACASYVPA